MNYFRLIGLAIYLGLPAIAQAQNASAPLPGNLAGISLTHNGAVPLLNAACLQGRQVVLRGIHNIDGVLKFGDGDSSFQHTCLETAVQATGSDVVLTAMCMTTKGKMLRASISLLGTPAMQEIAKHPGCGPAGNPNGQSSAQRKADELPTARTSVLAYSVMNAKRDAAADPLKEYYMGHKGKAAWILQGKGDVIEIARLGGGLVAFTMKDAQGKDLFLTGADNSASFEPVLSDAAKFYPRAPLENSDPTFASFESLAFPGQFLRHQGFQLKLDAAGPKSPSLLRRDATFRFQPVK